MEGEGVKKLRMGTALCLGSIQLADLTFLRKKVPFCTDSNFALRFVGDADGTSDELVEDDRPDDVVMGSEGVPVGSVRTCEGPAVGVII